jgi:eukaryotic-like serine/threonine-protein kinase
MALEGSERKVLHAILHEQGEASAGYVDDTKIAEIAHLSIDEVRDCLENLDAKVCVQRSIGVGGHSAYITARGRQELRRSLVVDVEERAASPLKIVPKGLRSFDAEDKDFFLDLLPGPRRGDGLPESVHFWKIRIEEMDPDKAFRVGLIYGPSGCGKSSLLKAGLLPRLARHITAAYVEATSDDTGTRLQREVRKRFPDLPRDLDLAQTISALRERIRPGQKLLIVLDQFEQWLHANANNAGTELVAALSHCDGQHVQLIILVRDDFWMATNRFEAQLGVVFRRDLNSHGMDLFDQQHATKVLAAFGSAYGKLDDAPTNDQERFLDKAVKGLAQDGKLIPVRLALLAEVFRGREWSTQSLKEVGGAEGVGVEFLKETFELPHATPRYRRHRNAIVAVLKTLLPEDALNINQRKRSDAELLASSGYAQHEKDYKDLISVLNDETGLITPIDNVGEDFDGGPRRQVTSYKITHEYLMTPIKLWITSVETETLRGRADLLLAERYATWKFKRENRLLPSVYEWFQIYCFSNTSLWSGGEREMLFKKTPHVISVSSYIITWLATLLAMANLNKWNLLYETSRSFVIAGILWVICSFYGLIFYRLYQTWKNYS